MPSAGMYPYAYWCIGTPYAFAPFEALQRGSACAAPPAFPPHERGRPCGCAPDCRNDVRGAHSLVRVSLPRHSAAPLRSCVEETHPVEASPCVLELIFVPNGPVLPFWCAPVPVHPNISWFSTSRAVPPAPSAMPCMLNRGINQTPSGFALGVALLVS